MKIMENNKDLHGVERANKEWDLLSKEAQLALKTIVGKLNHPSFGITVTGLAKTWFVLEHPSREYKVQLQVVAQGSNLDMSIFTPGESNYMSSDLTSVKLDKENVNFGVQRALATFGLHNRVVSETSLSESSIKHNDRVSEKFQSEHNFDKKYKQNSNTGE